MFDESFKFFFIFCSTKEVLEPAFCQDVNKGFGRDTDALSRDYRQYRKSDFKFLLPGP